MDLVAIVKKHNSLGIHDVIDHKKFNHISIVHHSAKIEGFTLTGVDSSVIK